jgi:cytoskeletal protein CcmA (bactofilin family)
MSPIPEWKFGAYVDGELSPAEVREVEAELVRSQRARELVLALRDEARLLGDVLQGRSRAAVRSVAAEPPARGLAVGVPISLAIAGGVLAVLSFLIEAKLPSGIDWLNPFRLLGVYEMAFDLIFLLRDSAPGLVELTVALAATASFAALATFATSAILRRFAAPTALSLALLAALASPQPATALDLRLHQSAHVTEDETVEGTLVVNGEFAHIDGVVRGDVFALVERMTVRGRIEGNLFAVARDIELSGEIEGSVHAAAENMNVAAHIRGSLYTANDTVTLAPQAQVDRDVAHLAERVRIEGTVNRDLTAGGERVEIRGVVGRDVEIWADEVKVLANSNVAGDVVAHVPDESHFEVADGAVIGGESSVKSLETMRRSLFARYTQGRFYFWLLIHLGASFVVGLLLYALLPRLFAGRLASSGEFFRSLGIGFAVLVLSPLVLALIGLTLVGLPLALMGGALYVSAIYLAGILVAALIGVSVAPPRSPGLRDFGASLLVGVVILGVATHVPIIGGILRVLVLLVGLGLLAERIQSAWLASRPALARS